MHGTKNFTQDTAVKEPAKPRFAIAVERCSHNSKLSFPDASGRMCEDRSERETAWRRQEDNQRQEGEGERCPPKAHLGENPITMVPDVRARFKQPRLKGAVWNGYEKMDEKEGRKEEVEIDEEEKEG